MIRDEKEKVKMVCETLINEYLMVKGTKPALEAAHELLAGMEEKTADTRCTVCANTYLPCLGDIHAGRILEGGNDGEDD